MNKNLGRRELRNSNIMHTFGKSTTYLGGTVKIASISVKYYSELTERIAFPARNHTFPNYYTPLPCPSCVRPHKAVLLRLARLPRVGRIVRICIDFKSVAAPVTRRCQVSAHKREKREKERETCTRAVDVRGAIKRTASFCVHKGWRIRSSRNEQRTEMWPCRFRRHRAASFYFYCGHRVATLARRDGSGGPTFV